MAMSGREYLEQAKKGLSEAPKNIGRAVQSGYSSTKNAVINPIPKAAKGVGSLLDYGNKLLEKKKSQVATGE